MNTYIISCKSHILVSVYQNKRPTAFLCRQHFKPHEFFSSWIASWAGEANKSPPPWLKAARFILQVFSVVWHIPNFYGSARLRHQWEDTWIEHIECLPSAYQGLSCFLGNSWRTLFCSDESYLEHEGNMQIWYQPVRADKVTRGTNRSRVCKKTVTHRPFLLQLVACDTD